MTNAEVDQSIKMNDLARDTVLAIANGISYTIVVPAAVKRTVMQHLREAGKSRTHAVVFAFAVALYLLLKNVIHMVDQICVDVEYMGHEAEIKNALVTYLRRDNPHFDSTRILFQHIGKKSSAHHCAIEVARRHRLPDKRIREEEFWRVISKRK